MAARVPLVAIDAGQWRALAQRAVEPPVLDGVLDEAAWAAAEPITDFVQIDPMLGAPPSEPTEVRILYDADYLYIGARLHDRDPAHIVRNVMVRQARLFGEDRLRALVEEHGELSSEELRERILREVEAFVGDADPHDDMTMILLKVEETASGPIESEPATTAAMAAGARASSPPPSQ